MTDGNDPISGTKTVQRTDFDGLGVGVYDVEVPSSLTKREYFAAMAMQGICANASLISQTLSGKDFISQVTDTATIYADALIAELNKPQEKK